jgi:hypothetical protein
MAAADITITGHAAAGYHSNLGDKAGKAAVPGICQAGSYHATTGAFTPTDAAVFVATGADGKCTNTTGFQQLTGSAATSGAAEGIYSNVGVDFALSGATDNGIAFTASMNIDAGTEIDQGDYEYDGKDGGTAGLGAVTMSGAFGTLTFDDGGIDNLYNGDYSSHDISYATTVNGIALTIAADADESVAAGAAGTDDASMSASYAAGGITYTLTASNHATAGMSTKIKAAYTVNDMLSVNLSSDSVSTAGKKAVAGVGATIVSNGLTVTVASDNAQPSSGWDLDLAYSLGDVALAYGTDEGSSHDITATYALGGGATFKAGMKNHGTSTAAKAAKKDSLYAGVAFTF